MKKILIAVSLFFASLGLVTAQQASPKAPAKKETKMAKATHRKDIKTAKASHKQDAKVTRATSKNLKKDGTPDMRLKENKVTAKTTVTSKVKKNGTLEMKDEVNKKK